jgi:hypothetical protein
MPTRTPNSIVDFEEAAYREAGYLYVRTNIKRYPNGVVESNDIRPATRADVVEATKHLLANRCTHLVLKLTPGYMYDQVDCAMCGQNVDAV